MTGPRVTDQILCLVPNVDVFRDALRCIKLWASRPCLAHMCFAAPTSYFLFQDGRSTPTFTDSLAALPGIYLLRAYVSYIPTLSLVQLLADFLSLCINGALQILICRDSYLTSLRSWPQPVLLKQIEDGPLQVRVWNPRVRPPTLASRAYSDSSSSCTLAIEHIECLSSLLHILLCVPPTM